MTVGELIGMLSEHNLDKEVYVNLMREKDGNRQITWVMDDGMEKVSILAPKGK